MSPVSDFYSKYYSGLQRYQEDRDRDLEREAFFLSEYYKQRMQSPRPQPDPKPDKRLLLCTLS